MADIFVSYARADKARVAPIVAALEAQGWSVWWDPHITPGQEFDALISDQIKQARAVLVVWTSVSVQSRWVRGEARMAVDRGILVPLRFDAPELPIDARSMHTADFDDWGEDTQSRPFQDLLRALRALIPDEGEGLTHASADIAGPETKSRAALVSPPGAGGGTVPGPQTEKRRRGLAVAGLAAVVLALAGAGLWLARGSLPREAPAPVRVAIVPFRFDPNDPTLRQLADGMTDKTVEVLTANQIETTSPRAEAGGPDPRALNTAAATFILGGSVRREGGMLRVNAQIEDARQKVVLWSAEMAAPVAKASTLELTAAARLAEVLGRAADGREEGLDPADTETLALNLRCYDLSVIDFSGQAEPILALARRIVTRAPGWSHGHSDLGYYSALYSDRVPASQRDALRSTARKEADKAIALNPRNGDAYVVLDTLTPPGQRSQREALLLRAVAVSSDQTSADANSRYGGLLSEVGRLQEALVYFQRAAALGPLDGGNRAQAALAQARAGQTDRADATLKAVLHDWPDNPGVRSAQFQLSRWLGRFEVALSMLQGDSQPNNELSDAERTAWRGAFSALISRDPRRMTQQREAQIAFGSTSPLDLSFSVENLSQLGLIDDAFTQAAKLEGVQLPIDETLLFDPSTAAMRRDRRFMALAARLGLVDYWRSSGHWPDFCAEPAPPYDCKAEAAKVTQVHHG